MVVDRIRWWRLHSTTHLWTRRWLHNPSAEAQSLEQWGHWKSVVVINAEAALWCLSLAAVSFWHRASSKLPAALWTQPHHFGLSMAYPSRSLGLMWHHISFDRVFIPQFWSTLVSFAGLEFPVHQAFRDPTLLHSNHVSNPSKISLDNGGLYAGGFSLIEDWWCGPATWFLGWSGEPACGRALVSWYACDTVSTSHNHRGGREEPRHCRPLVS